LGKKVSIARLTKEFQGCYEVTSTFDQEVMLKPWCFWDSVKVLSIPRGGNWGLDLNLEVS
jgi:hypothetical protein